MWLSESLELLEKQLFLLNRLRRKVLRRMALVPLKMVNQDKHYNVLVRIRPIQIMMSHLLRLVSKKTMYQNHRTKKPTVLMVTPQKKKLMVTPQKKKLIALAVVLLTIQQNNPMVMNRMILKIH